MESRERWQALQAKIAAARAALGAGDRTRALQEINAALEIDPHYLAAQALKDRIGAAALAPQLPSPSALAGTEPRPIVSAEQYARFEERARRRRVDRRLDAARLSITTGRWKEAAAALQEVAELDPNLPELPPLLEKVEEMRQTGGRRHVGPWFAAAAVFAALVLGASWIEQTAFVLSRPLAPEPPAVAAAQPTPAPVPLADVAAPLERAAIVPSAAAAPAPQPPPADRDAPASPPEPRRPAPDRNVVAAVRELPTRPAASAPIETRPALPAPADPSAVLPQSTLPAPPPAQAPVVQAPVVVQPPVAQASNVRATTDPEAMRPAPDRTPPLVRAPVVDDEALVRQVLQRYRTAYEALDAQSAQAVWPAVNEAALARAFDGLESQRLSFDACTVQVGTDRAAATCRGTARYVPKVGNREARTEPRRWTFSLSKTGPEWKIDAARAER